MLIYVFAGLLAAIFVLAVWIRIAPTDLSRWHKTFESFAPGERVEQGGYKVVREIDDPYAVLVGLDAIIMATPRTRRIAGRPDDSTMSYVTRSRVWGFPDYTTVWVGADDTIDGEYRLLLKISGRLRFGQFDLGTNRARITDWLAQLDGETR